MKKNNLYKEEYIPNYSRIALLWGGVLGQKIKPRQAALCINQLYISDLIDSPNNYKKTVKIAETIFAYEAINSQE